MSFPLQLKKLMDWNGMRPVDLAKATGLSQAAISDYLNGKKEPRAGQSIRISQALNVSLDTLWETEFDPTKVKKMPIAITGDRLAELNLSNDSLDKLEDMVSFFDTLSDENWVKLVDYVLLLVNAQKSDADVK